MANELHLSVQASEEGAAQASESVGEYLAANQVPDETAYAVSLAIEELVTNTVKYGFQDDREKQIELAVSLKADEVLLRSADNGEEFDPFSAPEPNLDLPLEGRPIGGLGLHLIRKMSSRCEYRRQDGQNIIEITFKHATGGGQ